MNRFQKIMVGVIVGCALVLVIFALRSDATWGQLGFAALVLLGILTIPFSFRPARTDLKSRVHFEELDEGVRERIAKIASEGRKIEAIKEVRAATGLGLAEAKGIVDQIDQARAGGVAET